MTSPTGRLPRIALAVILVTTLLIAPYPPARAQEGPEPSILITLQTVNTSVVEILEILADRSGLNIVTGPTVQGRAISIRLRDTPFDEALNLVCRASGLGYERVGNSILVAEQGRLREQTGMTAHVFDLNYADANDVREALEVISPDIKAEVRANRLVMWAPPSLIEQAGRTIQDLDRKPLQVLLESRLIEVNTSKLLEVGIDWEKLTSWTGIFTEGDPGASTPDRLPTQLDFLDLSDSDRFYRQAEAYEVTLQALITEGAARVLANSKVVTVDGVPAEIFAGETIPVVITSLQSPGQAGGVFQTVQLQNIDVGIRLNITPRVSADGFITTLVEPEVSRIVGFVGPDDDLPQTSMRRASSLVRVRDGQKIHLGGLVSEEKRETIKKVPLLGHIPLLGYLFQSRREETVRLDLIIEITPRLVSDEGFTMPEPRGIFSEERAEFDAPARQEKQPRRVWGEPTPAPKPAPRTEQASAPPPAPPAPPAPEMQAETAPADSAAAEEARKSGRDWPWN